MTATLTAPGVYDLPEAEYHAHPALSSTGARKLLPPSCPALFNWWQTHPEPPKKEYDLGHAAHRFVLGEGMDIVCVDAADWRTNAAKAQRDEVRAAGGVALLADDYEQMQAMAVALRAHPVAAALFEAGSGKPEQSLFWRDGSGVECRARVDWLPQATGRRMVIGEYKTAPSADPEKFAKSAVDFGYAQQAAWYIDGVITLELDRDPAMVHIVQERTAPYLVSVIQLNSAALRIGRILNDRAIRIYKQCTDTGNWPGYSTDVVSTALPYWYERQFEDD